MSRIEILDCTLRDGGYVNNFQFGNKTIKDIIKRLSKASIDIIECGFLESGISDIDLSLYGSVQAISDVICEKQSAIMYVAMIQFGAMTADEIENHTGNSIDGIRITFHEHEIEQAFVLGKQLMDKGYKIFMQPVGTAAYEDGELLDLVHRVNKLKPYGFYIVDTLGTMQKQELLRMFHNIDYNMNPEIVLGFHSHNNLQMSFANAQELISCHTTRRIILDASVLGMGRGAGNLCTELITQYMNHTLGTSYGVTELLDIVDNYLMNIRENFPWGYSAPYYIAAIHKCHPNYATYLMNRQTINVKDIESIIALIPKEKKHLFDKSYISMLYNEYQSHYIDDAETVRELAEIWKDKNILLLAPGRSLIEEQNTITNYIRNNKPYIIAVNFTSSQYKENMIFISNLKRFASLEDVYRQEENVKIIVTSNIAIINREEIYCVNYLSYTNSDDLISDNAGMMLCHLLRKAGVNQIALAGFDGFETSSDRNYFDKSFINNIESPMLEIKTQRIMKCLEELQKTMKISFVTKSRYERI